MKLRCGERLKRCIPYPCINYRYVGKSIFQCFSPGKNEGIVGLRRVFSSVIWCCFARELVISHWTLIRCVPGQLDYSRIHSLVLELSRSGHGRICKLQLFKLKVKWDSNIRTAKLFPVIATHKKSRNGRNKKKSEISIKLRIYKLVAV